jgi:hypothetical protein
VQKGIATTTDYHAKLFAHELNRRHSVADDEKLAGALLDAQVDLNPHQVEAALFAFKSPLSKGATFADEVGLGNLPDKLALQRKARSLETMRDEAWRAYDQAAKEIETQKDELLDQVEEHLGQDVYDETLFAIRFEIK